MPSPKKPQSHKCRICGCTNTTPCPGGCYWQSPTLCSRCRTLAHNHKYDKPPVTISINLPYVFFSFYEAEAKHRGCTTGEALIFCLKQLSHQSLTFASLVSPSKAKP